MPLTTMLLFLDFACAVIVGVILLAAIKLSADVAAVDDVDDVADDVSDVTPELPPPITDNKKCAFYPVETKMKLRRRQRKLGRTVGNKRRK
jgi:hypothetical protein